MEGRVRWFAEVLGAGLEKTLISPRDILDHATPELLAQHLPRETISALLRASLAAPKMSPATVIETVTPALLAQHVPHAPLWSCIVGGGERGGLVKEGDGALKKEEERKRQFLRAALQSGMDTGTLEARDVVRHVNASIIGYNFPNEITAKLLEASLSAGKMTPDTVLEAVGLEAMSKHAPVHILWACVADAARRALDSTAEVATPERLPTAPSAPVTGSRPRTMTAPPPPPAPVAAEPPPLAAAPIPVVTAAGDELLDIDEGETVEEPDSEKIGAKKRVGLFSRRKRV